MESILNNFQLGITAYTDNVISERMLPLHKVIILDATELGMAPKVQNYQWKDMYYSHRVNDVVIYFIMLYYYLEKNNKTHRRLMLNIFFFLNCA